MFYRYISENITDYVNAGEHAAGNTTYDYASDSDEHIAAIRNDLINEKGYFIPPSQLFTNVCKRAAAMKLGSFGDHEFDAFGDAYEYLMSMYASSAGKSGGEFFTPADVSELLTRLGTVGKTEVSRVYEIKCSRLIQLNNTCIS